MTVQQEVSQISEITEKAIAQLKLAQFITGIRLPEIEIALYELKDGVDFMKERIKNVN